MPMLTQCCNKVSIMCLMRLSPALVRKIKKGERPGRPGGRVRVFRQVRVFREVALKFRAVVAAHYARPHHHYEGRAPFRDALPNAMRKAAEKGVLRHAFDGRFHDFILS